MKYSFSLGPTDPTPNKPAPKVVRPPTRKAAQPAKGGESFLNKNKRWLAILLLLFLVPTVIWALLPDYKLKKALALQQQLDQGGEDSNLSPEERRAKAEQMRELWRDLTPAQLKVLRHEREQKEVVKMKEFAAMSLEDRNAMLDRQFQKEEQARQAREARDAQRQQDMANRGGGNQGNGGQGFGGNRGGGFNGGQNGPGGPGGGPGGFGQGNGPGGQRGQGKGQPGDGGPGGGPQGMAKQQMTSEVRDNRFRDHLGDSDPESRGLRYLMQVENQRRRAELGLPITGGGGRGGLPGMGGGGPPGGFGGGRGGPPGGGGGPPGMGGGGRRGPG